jgi:hypothetical protein
MSLTNWSTPALAFDISTPVTRAEGKVSRVVCRIDVGWWWLAIAIVDLVASIRSFNIQRAKIRD